MSSLIKNDEKRLGLVSIELWTRQGNVGGWSACLNSTTAYPSDIPPGIEVKCSRTGVQGEFLYDQDTLVELSNQDSIHSSSLSSLSRTYATVSRSSLLNNMISGTVEIHLVSRIIIVSITAGLAYLMDCIAKSNFSRSIAKALIFTRQYIRGSTRQDSVRSPVVAEALTLQSGFITAENLELPTLKMLSDNSTFVRAINNDNQSKEIYGIVKNIQQLSSDFVDILFLLISRRWFGKHHFRLFSCIGPSSDRILGLRPLLRFNEFVQKKKE
ncbi:unnamed protein product [Brassica rapa]|uniref:RNase H type-1 domain-containing protein n=2 Tax=Brassica campestris TaxID=3711 RepID=A0A8D9D1K4_BRACM|nr:unnamed protein product [Brassica rapa]